MRFSLLSAAAALICLTGSGTSSPILNEESSTFTPETLAYSVMSRILESGSWFLNHELMWTYGAALINDGFFEMISHFPNNTENEVFSSEVFSFMDHYLSIGHEGFKILHETPIYKGYSIGDRIGLYPISYLNRYVHSSSPSSSDLLIAQKVATDHVLSWNIRLPDGTIARHLGWDGAPSSPTPKLWADDSFMGLTLLNRLAASNLGNENANELVSYTAKQLLGFQGHLARTDGLIAHGYDAASGSLSCCAWGRANGWLELSFVETLKALAAVGAAEESEDFEAVRAAFEAHASKLLDVQDESTGLWRQVLDVPATFLETSSSAMFVYAFAEGTRLGFLSGGGRAREFHDAIVTGWEGIRETVDRGGEVRGICQPTGVKADVEEYEGQKTDFFQSQESVGAVLKAAVAVDKYLAWYSDSKRKLP